MFGIIISDAIISINIVLHYYFSVVVASSPPMAHRMPSQRPREAAASPALWPMSCGWRRLRPRHLWCFRSVQGKRRRFRRGGR